MTKKDSDSSDVWKEGQKDNTLVLKSRRSQPSYVSICVDVDRVGCEATTLQMLTVGLR